MNLGLHGVNADFKHQYLVTCFIVELHARFQQFEKYKNYLVYPEFNLPKGKNPDVSIYIRKNGTQDPLVIIEICRTSALATDFEKIQKAMKKHPTITEGYLLDWETFDFFKVERNSNKFSSTDKIEAVSLPIGRVIKRYQKEINL